MTCIKYVIFTNKNEQYNPIQSNAIPNIILFFNKYEILFLHSFDK